ncbi:MAG: tetratricopeptide repeat protein, partial [Bacteroidetes bacterium]|nr:tetratricopeptide repeat protein [Bacteroidota bacterium]
MTRIIFVIAILISINSSLFSQSIDSSEVESWKIKGSQFKKAGQTDSAIVYFERVLEKNSYDYEATLNAAQLYLDAGEFKK